MEHLKVADMLVKHVIDDDLKVRVDELTSDEQNKKSLLEPLSEVFSTIEKSYLDTELVNDVVKAILSVLSGKILLKAKKVIGHGKWSLYAMDQFDMDEHERNLRMKAATIVGIENYYFLGWKRIAALTQATKRSKKPDPFKEIMDNICYKPLIDPSEPDDFEHFGNLVKAFVVRDKFSNDLKKKIKFEQIVDAVECEVDFNNAFVKKLEMSKNPATSLNNYIDFETLDTPAQPTARMPEIKKRELSILIHKLSFTGALVTDKTDKYLKKVPLVALEKCSKEVNRLLDFKQSSLRGF